MTKLLLSVLLAMSAGIAAAQAQTYPSRPVTLIVPFPAGGPSDVLARVLVEPMRAALGQPVIIENVSGAGGSLGTQRVARSAPDGYTIGLGHVQTHVINAATQNLQFDVFKDFEPVTLVADTPQWLVSNAKFPAKDMKELVAHMKANPGKVTAGTVGVGGPTDVAGHYFQKHTGTSFQFVPYKGGAPLIQDLVAGQIDITFGQAANYLGPVRNGQLRPFAVLKKERWWAAPDVPTIDEAGVPGLHLSFWHALWVPKGTPQNVIATINAAVSKALDDPALKKRYGEIGQEIFPQSQQNPKGLADFHKREADKWWPVIKAAGIKVQ
jgi:tripartite-type tricarboxylate transporter receptor subunit TctC